MPSRRKFIRSASLGGLVFARGSLFANGTPGLRILKERPVVICTWNFGQAANAGAWKVLESGGRALDAVESGVRIPEADPENRTIGYGGLPDRDGHVTLDACIMDDHYNCGSVMCLEHIMHPISVARLVMEKTPHIVLTGEGALNFALANGFEKINLLTPESEQKWKAWLKSSKYQPEQNIENHQYNKDNDPMPGGRENHDTIGMVALDANGNLSGACTTSGLAYKMRGRVGDSPIIGAGLYVDNETGAATATGVGEEVIRIVGAHLVVELMRSGLSPEKACRLAVERIVKINPTKAKKVQVGFVALNKQGEFGGYSLHPGFTYAVKSRSVEQLFPAKSHFPA